MYARERKYLKFCEKKHKYKPKSLLIQDVFSNFASP